MALSRSKIAAFVITALLILAAWFAYQRWANPYAIERDVR